MTVMECTGKIELADQRYEILVSFNSRGATIPVYARLRFALVGNAWWPKPLGMLLWSVLHVLLLVAGPPALLLFAVTRLVSSLLFDCLWVVMLATWVILSVLCWRRAGLTPAGNILVSGAILYYCLCAMLLKPMCYSDGHSWRHHSLIYEELLAERARRYVLKYCSLPEVRSLCKEIVYKWIPSWWRVWVGWCEEVVHMHDVIVI